MLKKILAVMAVALLLPAIAAAQKFGTIDVNAIFTAMPETTAAQTQLQEVSKKYEAEYKKLEEEVNNKVQEFQALAEGRQAAAPHPQLLVRRLPSQQIKAYLEAMKGVAEDPLQRQWEFYHRCRMLQDFFSGMTDQHAQDEYRALSAL